MVGTFHVGTKSQPYTATRRPGASEHAHTLGAPGGNLVELVVRAIRREAPHPPLAATALDLVNEEPIWNCDDLGQLDAALGEALLFVAGSDGNDIPRLEVHRRHIALAAVDGNVAVGNHLACATEGLREAHFLNNIVEAGLDELKKDFAGDAAAAACDLKVATELALEDAVLVAELLLFSKGDRVVALLAASALGAVHARRIVFILKGFGRYAEERVVAAADFCFWTGVACHFLKN